MLFPSRRGFQKARARFEARDAPTPAESEAANETPLSPIPT